MTKQEFSKAVTLARSDAKIDSKGEILTGCALPGFRPVACTIDDVAALLRWQCCQFNGGWDSDEMAEMYAIKNRFLMV